MKNIRIVILTFILLFSGFLIFYFRVPVQDEKCFTHFFYLPIILTAFWWQFRVIYLITFLVTVLLISDLLIADYTFFIHDIIRSFFFFIVGLSIAYLRKSFLEYNYLSRYRDILFSIQDPALIIDRSFNAIALNNSFRKVFGYQIHEQVNITSLINNDFKMKDFEEKAMQCFKGMNVFMGIFIQKENSEGNYYLVSFYPVKSGIDINYLILSFRDVTEKKRSEEQQKNSLERQRISIEVLERINMKTSSTDLLNDILNLIRGRTGVDALIINLKTGEQLYNFASHSLYHELKKNGRAVHDYSTVNEDHFLINVFDDDFCSIISGGNLFWTNNLHAYLTESGIKSENFHYPEYFLSCAIIPLKDGEDIIGYFMLLDRKEGFFDEELIAFYEGIVQSIEIAINRINYEEDLKRIIQEKELLLKEVHHRVKNNMQVIISLMSLQASRQKERKLRDVLNECQNRVRTMALVHEKLYGSENFTSINMNNYIRSLVPMLMTSYRVDRKKINVEIDALDTFFNLSIAIPLAQLVNELLSNVFKHAFKDGAVGNVEIALKPDVIINNRFSLSVIDDGTGLPPEVNFPDSGSLGFQLIDALVKQIKGEISFLNDRGVSCIIQFNEN
jgi:PAS domain S-box-containing protein